MLVYSFAKQGHPYSSSWEESWKDGTPILDNIILKKNEITIVNSTHDFEKFETSDHHINIRVSDESRSLEFYK